MVTLRLINFHKTDLKLYQVGRSNYYRYEIVSGGKTIKL